MKCSPCEVPFCPAHGCCTKALHCISEKYKKCTDDVSYLLQFKRAVMQRFIFKIPHQTGSNIQRGAEIVIKIWPQSIWKVAAYSLHISLFHVTFLCFLLNLLLLTCLVAEVSSCIFYFLLQESEAE